MSENLKKKVSKGLLWNAIHNFAMHGINFLLMLFMARILGPEEYGIIGIIGVFITLSKVFSEAGFGIALIRKKKRTQTDLSTVFYFNIVISFLCYIIIYIIAPFVASFFGIQNLTSVLRVLAISIIIGSFNIVQVAIMNYTMDFKKQAYISIIHTFISGCIGLALAYYGYGVWALVFQNISQSLIGLILCWILCDWRPSLIFSKKSFDELFGFSSKILITRIIDALYGNIYPIIIGKYFSAVSLGHYSRAHHWASFPSTNLINIVNNVTFASLSKIQDEEDRFRYVYRKMIKACSFFIFPMMFGLAAISKPLIYFTIGEKWDFCAQILNIICFTYIFSPILSLNTNLIQVRGRSDLSLKLTIIQKTFAIIVIFMSLPYGLLVMCYLAVASSIVMLLLNMYYIKKVNKIKIFTQVKDILPSLILASVMYVAVMLCIKYIDGGSLIQLLVGILIGIICYILPAYILRLEELKEIKSIIVSMLKNKNDKH